MNGWRLGDVRRAVVPGRPSCVPACGIRPPCALRLVYSVRSDLPLRFEGLPRVSVASLGA